jgi:large subunit ribosomal protein L21
MYAIVKIAGKQFKVAENDTITVDRLSGEVGTKVDLPVLLLGGDDATVGTPLLTGAKVQAEIIAHRQGKKINAFNYKAKKNERKRWGHRSHLSDLKIVKITKGK